MNNLNLKNAFEYYRTHESEYPTSFLLKNDDGVVGEEEYFTMNNKETGEWIATLERDGAYYIAYIDSFDINESCHPSRCYLDLESDCAKYQFDYNFHNPKDILDAFVDCVYLRMAYVKKKMSEFMYQIDGGD